METPKTELQRRQFSQGFAVINPGHKYELLTIDGDIEQTLQFVKRIEIDDPTKFPRNEMEGDLEYPGTTLQCVIRALAQRIRYLNGQKPCIENHIILSNLQDILWQLEKRAARRHGNSYDHSPEFAMNAPVCAVCGHTVCDH